MSKGSVTISDLVKIPFLAGLQPAELEAVLAAGRVMDVPQGDAVFSAGEAGEELCIVLDGEVAIELAIEKGPPRLLAALGTGTVFGEISFLLGSHRTATARATRRARVLCLTRDALERVSQQAPQAVVAMIETLARILALRLETVDQELAEICGRIRTEHPEATPLLETLEDRRRRLRHEWAF